MVRIRLFARARDLAETETLDLTLAPGTTVGELRERLAIARPALAALLDRCAVAIDQEFAENSFVLDGPAEIAVLPPVSGGMQTGGTGPMMPRQS